MGREVIEIYGNKRKGVSDIIKDVKAYLSYLKEIGIEDIPISSSVNSGRSKTPSPEEALRILMDEIKDCHRCKLYKGRTRIVFGVGNPNAELVFVGEAPGRDEDLQGEPFVGEAGQLLTRIIEAMGLKREDVYIANVVKCRPPENRNPEPDEIEVCEPFLLRQLDIIRPKVICALGTFASQCLLRTKGKISELRGNFYYYHNMKVMPTYHPAYLLRNPGDKRLVWEDMKRIMAELNLRGIKGG